MGIHSSFWSILRCSTSTSTLTSRYHPFLSPPFVHRDTSHVHGLTSSVLHYFFVLYHDYDLSISYHLVCFTRIDYYLLLLVVQKNKNFCFPQAYKRNNKSISFQHFESHKQLFHFRGQQRTENNSSMIWLNLPFDYHHHHLMLRIIKVAPRLLLISST